MLKTAIVIATCVLALAVESQGQPPLSKPGRGDSVRSVRARVTVPVRLRLVDSLSSKYLAAEVRRQRNGDLVAFISSTALSVPVLADVIASLRGHVQGDSKYPQGLTVTFIARRYRPRLVAGEDTGWLNEVMFKLRQAKHAMLSPGGKLAVDSIAGDS